MESKSRRKRKGLFKRITPYVAGAMMSLMPINFASANSNGENNGNNFEENLEEISCPEGSTYSNSVVSLSSVEGGGIICNDGENNFQESCPRGYFLQSVKPNEGVGICIEGTSEEEFGKEEPLEDRAERIRENIQGSFEDRQRQRSEEWKGFLASLRGRDFNFGKDSSDDVDYDIPLTCIVGESFEMDGEFYCLPQSETRGTEGNSIETRESAGEGELFGTSEESPLEELVGISTSTDKREFLYTNPEQCNEISRDNAPLKLYDCGDIEDLEHNLNKFLSVDPDANYMAVLPRSIEGLLTPKSSESLRFIEDTNSLENWSDSLESGIINPEKISEISEEGYVVFRPFLGNSPVGNMYAVRISHPTQESEEIIVAEEESSDLDKIISGLDEAIDDFFQETGEGSKTEEDLPLASLTYETSDESSPSREIVPCDRHHLGDSREERLRISPVRGYWGDASEDTSHVYTNPFWACTDCRVTGISRVLDSGDLPIVPKDVLERTSSLEEKISGLERIPCEDDVRRDSASNEIVVGYSDDGSHEFYWDSIRACANPDVTEFSQVYGDIGESIGKRHRDHKVSLEEDVESAALYGRAELGIGINRDLTAGIAIGVPLNERVEIEGYGHGIFNIGSSPFGGNLISEETDSRVVESERALVPESTNTYRERRDIIETNTQEFARADAGARVIVNLPRGFSLSAGMGATVLERKINENGSSTITYERNGDILRESAIEGESETRTEYGITPSLNIGTRFNYGNFYTGLSLNSTGIDDPDNMNHTLRGKFGIKF